MNDIATPTYADGTDGAIFSVTDEVKIGRDKDSDIRVKIPSVSRNHARVYQDENGNVSRHRHNSSSPIFGFHLIIIPIDDTSCSVPYKIFQSQISQLLMGNSLKISCP